MNIITVVLFNNASILLSEVPTVSRDSGLFLLHHFLLEIVAAICFLSAAILLFTIAAAALIT
jgi:hypothetical protein